MPPRPLAWCVAMLLAPMGGCAPVAVPAVDRYEPSRNAQADLDAALAALRDRRFVQIEVYVGSDNRNEAVLARLPRLAWVPTLVVLDADGSVVRHAPSTALHDNRALDRAKVLAFLTAEP